MVEVRIEAETSKYAPDSPQWRNELAELHRMLGSEAGSVSLRPNEGAEGTRGVLETVVLALLSPAAIAGGVACFKAWIGRDKTRSLKVSWSEGDTDRHITLTGENIDQRSMQSLAESIGRTLEGR
ncbi:hypothetical protein AB0B28_03270 [Glycomyces sp. NPDC046736]|uniref:effector-associated constant component EACC1 n=1 Tax=Glycomyces sp. NPDC046736 TaxID=3155615 RepID=UPI0033F77197